MAQGRVTGVLWWEMTISHYKAVFRRGNSAGYTKDFLQGTKPIARTLREMLGGEPPYESLTYRWPGGSYPGKVYLGTDRLEIGQWTASGAPGPWRIGDPAADPLVTLEGDPDASIPAGADAQWHASIAPTRPWLMMVQLRGEPDVLNLRAYLEAPPPHLRHASLDRVPAALRSMMRRNSGLAGEALPELWFDPEDLRDPWRAAAATGGTSPPPPAPPVPRPPGPLGAEYRPANESVSSAAPQPFDVDPDERDRGTEAHAVTQNGLSKCVRERGFTPRSPRPGEPNYDIAWEEGEALVVGEVKSVTAKNSEEQLRLALGQLLRYRDLLEDGGGTVHSLIVLSAPPHDERWIDLCEKYDVGLIWMPELGPMLAAWLD
jgi:hypothetical protein